MITVHDLIPWLQARAQFLEAPVVGPASRWLWRANLRAMRQASALCCVSHHTAHDVRAALAHERPLSVAWLPLRPGLQDLAERREGAGRDPDLVLHVGHNGFYKWRTQVLRVFARLAPRRRLQMLGPPPAPELRRLAAELGIEERVEFRSDPDDATLAATYRRASLLLFPSQYEGFGWPVLEAMAFGLPVICSNRASLPEISGGACPALDPNDVAAFATEAESILSNPERARALVEAGIARAESFSLRGFASTMGSIYAQTLERVHAPRGVL